MFNCFCPESKCRPEPAAKIRPPSEQTPNHPTHPLSGRAEAPGCAPAPWCPPLPTPERTGGSPRLRFGTLVPTPAGSGGLRVASALYPRAPALRLSKFSLLT
ncbi:MAG: hypothetical protein RLZZ436_778, partial [Planctomycetota bacterium]